MNGHLTRFCGARDISFTRSRPYQGNDNPHVEEKNNSAIRTFVGTDRESYHQGIRHSTDTVRTDAGTKVCLSRDRTTFPGHMCGAGHHEPAP